MVQLETKELLEMLVLMELMGYPVQMVMLVMMVMKEMRVNMAKPVMMETKDLKARTVAVGVPFRKQLVKCAICMFLLDTPRRTPYLHAQMDSLHFGPATLSCT